MVSPVLLLAVPLGLAFLVPLVGAVSKRAAGFVPVIASLFSLVVSLRLLPVAMAEPIVVNLGGFSPPFGINLYAGPLGILLSAIIALAGLAASVYALSYIKSGSTVRYHTLYVLLLVGATGVVLTGDVFNLFVFFEVLCISSFALVAHIGNKASIEASVKYLIQGALGSALLLIGIGLLYGLFGTLNMAHIAAQVGTAEPVPLFVAMTLIVVGLGVEGAIFPLNAWLPDAHSSAPSPISAILSGVAIEVGLYAVIRMVFTVFGASDMLLFFMLLGLLTLLIGELCAFAQSNVKRMLAYSSIGQIGLILFAIAIATTHSVTGGLFQLVSHTLAKVLLFLSIGFMVHRSGSMEISSLAGMGKRMPLTSLVFTIGAFSLVGLPPFAGFASKFLIVRASLAQGDPLLAVLIGLVLVATVIEGAYFFRVIQTIYFGQSDADLERRDAPVTALLPMFLFAVLIVVVGVYPNLITGVLNSAAVELLDRARYVGSVLG